MKIKSNGLINLEIDGKIYDYKLYESLNSLNNTHSQRKSAKELKISHAVFNRRIKKAEEKLGFKIVNNSSSGSELTKEGLMLLEEYQKYTNQISPTAKITIGGGHIISGLLESINQPFDLSVYSSTDIDAFELGKRGVVDILALDDPLIAFERDLNFIPIAFDYLVLVANENSKKIKSLKDMENLRFVSVKGSAQRLAWDSLKHYDIKFNIKEKVNSQFDAYKQVRSSKNLHTFLNASYFKGNELLKFDTQHVISLVKVNEDNPEIDELIRYLTKEGQKDIEKQGFAPM